METSWQSLPDEDKERYFVKSSPVTPKWVLGSLFSDCNITCIC
jgi:hypothetical protein